MHGQKILISGPTGQVADPVARALASENEVVGIARFRDADKRASLEAAGVRCVPVDFADGDFGALDDDFDVVLNLAVVKSPEPDFEHDLRANAEATGRLMSHCRRARAFLHCSSTAVYEADDHTVFTESSPLGDNHRVMMPTYSLAKISAEVVARFAAREFSLPTVIARLNTPYGSNGGWPWYHLKMMENDVPIPLHPNQPCRYTPIHEEDIIGSLPALLDAAAVPAVTVNWCGQEHVAIEEWCAYMGELTGLEPKFQVTDRTLESVMTDNTKLRALAGPAKVAWRDGIRRMVETREPGLLRNPR